MSVLSVWLAALPGLAVLALAAWLASLARRDVSIVDSVWALFFVAAASAYAAAGTIDARALVVFAVLLLWALRLSVYLTWRNWGEPEDRRYQAIRRRNEPGFALKSLYLVFGLQALLAWVVSLALVPAFVSAAPLGWLDALALLVWSAGFAVETAADAQLARFKADPANAGRVLDHGLWRYSRHPNYFGECLLWWGFWLFACAAGGWWSVLSPLLMTVLLLRVSGVTLLEHDIAERRPAYREYIERTSAFVPLPPRPAADSAQVAR